MQDKECKDVKEIKVFYEDGTEKTITRGVVFSVYDEGEDIKVSNDGIAGGDNDVLAVLAIVARVAKDMGIDEELFNKAEEVKADES